MTVVGTAKQEFAKYNCRKVPVLIERYQQSSGAPPSTLKELEIDFEARLVFGDETPSELKKSLLGLFKRKDYEKHNIRGIEVDSGKNSDGSGMAKIKVKFKSDEKPEAVSRLVDLYIQSMDDPSVIKE